MELYSWREPHEKSLDSTIMEKIWEGNASKNKKSENQCTK